MSRKNVLLPYTDPLISAQSMASSFSGTPVFIQYEDNIGVQLKWVGSDPLGVIGVQVSLDYNSNTKTGTWTPLEEGSSPLTVSPGGTAGNAYLDLNQLSAPWLQVTYTTAGGSSGFLTATYGAKMIG
jgi:hypothetical protein